jgi:hypothetical protein
MLLTWVKQSVDTWNARSDGDSVVIEKRLSGGRMLCLRAFRDGGVHFLSSIYITGRDLREMNAAIGEARAYLNQPVYERGD